MSDTARNINLENNMIGPDGCSFISSIVRDNGYITDLVSNKSSLSLSLSYLPFLSSLYFPSSHCFTLPHPFSLLPILPLSPTSPLSLSYTSYISPLLHLLPIILLFPNPPHYLSVPLSPSALLFSDLPSHQYLCFIHFPP